MLIIIIIGIGVMSSLISHMKDQKEHHQASTAEVFPLVLEGSHPGNDYEINCVYENGNDSYHRNLINKI